MMLTCQARHETGSTCNRVEEEQERLDQAGSGGEVVLVDQTAQSVKAANLRELDHLAGGSGVRSRR